MKNQTKSAIIYLVGPDIQDRVSLRLSLSYLDKNFNNQFHYPVILFHENLNEKLMEEIQKSTLSELRFEKVVFQIPNFLQKDEIPESYHGFSVGYRHMCRFFSGIVADHSALIGYNWYWRLDTDSFLLDKVSYDPFLFMEENKYVYGYMVMMKDLPKVTKGFWGVTQAYIKKYNIKPTFLHKFLDSDGVWDRTYYNTNFEIIKLDFLRSSKFRNYFDFLDRLGGIYKYRWGDTLVHSLAVYMFLPEHTVHWFNDISYCHQYFKNLPLTLQIFKPFHKRLIDVMLKLKLERLKAKI